MARRLADRIEQNPTGAAWDRAAPVMRALAEDRPMPAARAIFEQITSTRVAPRQRAMMHEIAAEYYGCWGMNDDAIEHIERGVRLPAFANLLWLDRCPSLDGLRSDPRLSTARAIVAARASQIWE